MTVATTQPQGSMITGSVGKKRRSQQLFTNILAWIILVALALPAFWIVLTAFRTNAEVNANPTVWIPHELTFPAVRKFSSITFAIDTDSRRGYPPKPNELANKCVLELPLFNGHCRHDRMFPSKLPLSDPLDPTSEPLPPI